MFNFKAQRAHYCCSLNLSPSHCHKGLWQQTHPSVWLIQHTSSEAIRPDRWFTLPRELQREAVFLFHTLDGTESVISLLLLFFLLLFYTAAPHAVHPCSPKRAQPAVGLELPHCLLCGVCKAQTLPIRHTVWVLSRTCRHSHLALGFKSHVPWSRALPI